MLYCPENRLLAALSPAIYQRLAPELERVCLREGRILLESGEGQDYFWFINTGIVSVRPTIHGGEAIEAVMIGREGAVGLPNLAGTTAAFLRARVLIAGEAQRIRTARLLAMCQENRELLQVVFGYLQGLIAQFPITMMCLYSHGVPQRLACWLLMVHDRSSYDTLRLTHENIARRLGTSRSNVSTAAGLLQAERSIRYARGSITILDRAALMRASCKCYGILSWITARSLPSQCLKLTESVSDEQMRPSGVL